MLNLAGEACVCVCVFCSLITSHSFSSLLSSFTSVSGFEFTPELSIFDLLGVGLYHGWLVDPSDTALHTALAHCSYNQLVGKVIEGNDTDDSLKVQDGKKHKNSHYL